jgi:Protein of unknown function (DUF559)/AbiEi antitoxin C-terminal domain
MAAVLAGGSGALLSHRSAAALWGIRMTDRARVDVTVPSWRRSRSGFEFHHARPAEDERTEHRGIPVTTPARTLLDLAAVLDAHRLERAIDEAEVRRLADHVPLHVLVERHAGRRGVAALRRLLEAGHIGATITRSELEDRFLAFLDEHGIERPALNVRLGAIEVDAVWPAQRLVAEIDGFAVHGTRAAFERDRARDRALQAAGHRVLRVTWRQLATDPHALAADLEALLRD